MLNERGGFYGLLFCVIVGTVVLLIEMSIFLFNQKNAVEMLVIFVGLLGMSILFSVIVSRTPLVLNMVHTEHVGIVKECEWISWDYDLGIGRFESYTIIIKEEKNQKKEKFKNVHLKGKVEMGDEVEIHSYSALGNVLVKLNGKAAEYYTQGFLYHSTEKLFLVLGIVIHTIILIAISRWEYVVRGKKKRGRNWHYLGVASALLYLIMSVISLKCVLLSGMLGKLMGVFLEIYLVTEVGVAWSANIDNNREKWEILWESVMSEEAQQRERAEKMP